MMAKDGWRRLQEAEEVEEAVKDSEDWLETEWIENAYGEWDVTIADQSDCYKES